MVKYIPEFIIKVANLIIQLRTKLKVAIFSKTQPKKKKIGSYEKMDNKYLLIWFKSQNIELEGGRGDS